MKKIFNEFKTFIARGNVIDLSVGVVMGTAFSKIVTSLVNDVIMPLVGIAIGGIDFTSLSIKLGDAVINYGNFIQEIVNFLIIAFCIFIIVKAINKLTENLEKSKEKLLKKDDKKKEEIPKEEVKSNEELLLIEIRDLLKKQVKTTKK